MRVFNIMMSRDLGGIQQAYLDYSAALKMHNHEVINISSMGAKINKLQKSNYTLPNIGTWCIFSKIILRILILFYKPQLIICHGNRAINFARKFAQKKPLLVGVSHNYSYKYLKKCDYVITLTDELKEHLIKHGIEKRKLLSLPNMTKIEHSYNPINYSSPIVIGALGRFVSKKGFIYLVEAFFMLKNAGYNIVLFIGGDGEDRPILERKVKELQLDNLVIFPGWVNDKDDFFRQIDIFCLPSTIEPFGIILLEAMEHSKPIVATFSGGPSEIITDGENGLLADIESSQSLYNKLEKIIIDPRMARKLSSVAYSQLKEKYDINIVSRKLSTILEDIIKQ